MFFTKVRLPKQLLLAAGVFSVIWWVWPGLYEASPQFYYLLIEKNDQPLRLLNGESLHLNPKDRVKVLKISTNISFNIGVRMVTTGLDVNALRYEKLPVATLLPNRESFAQYRFRVEIKHHNQDMGYVDLVVEPYAEDWLDKVDRTFLFFYPACQEVRGKESSSRLLFHLLLR